MLDNETENIYNHKRVSLSETMLLPKHKQTTGGDFSFHRFEERFFKVAKKGCLSQKAIVLFMFRLKSIFIGTNSNSCHFCFNKTKDKSHSRFKTENF